MVERVEQKRLCGSGSPDSGIDETRTQHRWSCFLAYCFLRARRLRSRVRLMAAEALVSRRVSSGRRQRGCHLLRGNPSLQAASCSSGGTKRNRSSGSNGVRTGAAAKVSAQSLRRIKTACEYLTFRGSGKPRERAVTGVAIVGLRAVKG